MSKKKKDWKVEKARLLGLTLDERRKEYSSYVPLDKIPTWKKQEKSKGKEEVDEQDAHPLSDKVSLYKGDITILEIDAIVNAANSSLLGGGGVDGCIHKAAGPCLYEECTTLNGCDTGNAKMTGGYELPAKYVIHTVGPVARGHVGKSQRELLKDCYQNSLKLMKENGLRSVAFPCISTGIYGYPNEPAAEIALATVKSWLKKNCDEVDRVIFCVFLDTDFRIYKDKMFRFFSQDNDRSDDRDEPQPEEGKKGTPPTKKPKSKKPSKGDEDHEEEEKNKDHSIDANMESQKEEEDQSDVDMQSQNLEPDHPDPEETEEKKDEKVPTPDISRREEGAAEGDRQSEDAESAVDSEESRSSAGKDEAKPQSAQMAAAGAAGCLEKELPAAEMEESMDVDQSVEPLEPEGVEGDPVPKDKLTNEENESSSGEAEMKTQGEESGEAEVTPADSNQSKGEESRDGVGHSEGP
ncbi:ADP-ribose glycohydrolase MACROD2 isoform X2 [Anguilla anguilla]|uniref:ADP-ribose glycohydrolase MACROD2 isoform X2 n=1 Tax=Anguilla anguilla TaxID=7936 RepID=UPI0015AD51F3|nr:ADP-ribose glycohydrolase MACROD2 isoform X2 [Anguilla anguilla]